MIDSFGLSEDVKKDLKKFDFRQIMAIYRKRKAKTLTVFDVKQNLGFLTDKKIIDDFEQSIRKDHPNDGAKVAGGHPVTFFVFTAISAFAILLAILIGSLEIKRQDKLERKEYAFAWIEK
jgi:hypothetical protein